MFCDCNLGPTEATVNTINLILRSSNCCKITTRFWSMIWGAQWVSKWTYLDLLLRTWSFSSWWCHMKMQTHFVPKTVHLAVILRQLHNGIHFGILDPGMAGLNNNIPKSSNNVIFFPCSSLRRRHQREQQGHKKGPPDLRTGHIGSRLRSPSGRVK